MNHRPFFWSFRPLAGAVLMALLLTLLGGCQAKEPPLSPKAAAFKKEVQDCLDRLRQGVESSIINGNIAGINETLKRIEPQNLKLCLMCPFRIAVLDKHAQVLTVYPYKPEAEGDYSKYGLVKKTMENRQINQRPLYLQDGSQIYIICAPLKNGQRLVGLLVISLSAKDAKNHYGVTEKEFMAIDFNLKS